MTEDNADHYADPTWLRWLFQQHRPDELREWSRRLRWFRYCRAVGGHANDGDTLRIALRAATEQDLLTHFSALGIEPTHLTIDAPQPIPGVAYTSAEYAEFPSRIPEHPHLAQPGHIVIAGETAFATAGSGRLEIWLSDQDDPYEVTEHTVSAATTIEPLLPTFALIDPPLNHPRCICPKFHPTLFPT